MYLSFFGLNEKPFAITPDPRYLYLSERHAEALAHLLYGINESGGFIQLTGEVGTGKTTVVRTLALQTPKGERTCVLETETELWLHDLRDDFFVPRLKHQRIDLLLVETYQLADGRVGRQAVVAAVGLCRNESDLLADLGIQRAFAERAAEPERH